VQTTAVKPHRIKRVVGVVAALAFTVLVAAPAGAATSTTGSVGLRLLEAPLTAGNDPRAQMYIVDHLAPGAIINRRVQISNTTSSSTHVFLYAAAATIRKGSFLGAEGATPNELSTWTSIEPGSVDIPAGGLAEARVTIAVPEDAAPGEQYAVVWAEERSTPKDGGGIVQVSRVGIRVYLSVGPGNPPAADFTIDSLTAKRLDDGRPVVLASVHNTGGRALDMNGTLQLLDGPSGLSAGPFPASLGTTLAVGDTESVTIPLDVEVPDGPWDARITLRSGLLEHSARARITFPDAGDASPAITMSTRPGGPYVAVAGGIFLIVLGTTRLVAARRRRQFKGWAPSRPVSL
jgi:hypothetical protein